MAYQGINTGSTPNDGAGDTLLDGGVKINSNFLELYNLVGDGSELFVGIVTQITAGTNVSVSTAYGSVEISSSIPSTINTTNLNISGVSTLSNVLIGTANTEMIVTGDTRITGILTVGTDSVTIDGNNTIVNVGSGLTLDGGNNLLHLGDQITIDTSLGIITAFSIKVGNQEITDNGNSVSSLNVTGVSTLTGNVSLGSSLILFDDQKILIGDSADMIIYKNDSVGNIIQDNIASFNIRSDNFNSFSEDGSNLIFSTNADGNHGIELYHNNQKRLETRTGGVRILGNLEVQSGVTTLGIVTGATYYGDGSNLTGIVHTIAGIDTEGISIFNGIDASGIITASSFSGDGSNLTGLATTEKVSTDSLVVSGICTLGIVTGATYYGDGSNLTGIDNSIVGIDTTGTSTFNQINASGIITSTGGFISAASTSACQITFSGNTLTFTVVGVGSTTLTLF